LGGLLRLLPSQALAAYFGADPAGDLLDAHVRIPGIQGAHARGLANSFPVLPDPGQHHRAPVSAAEPKITARDLEASGQAFDIPLPGTGKRLVEVVDVEHQLPLRRAEYSEVRQVRVAAQLHGNA